MILNCIDIRMKINYTNTLVSMRLKFIVGIVKKGIFVILTYMGILSSWHSQHFAFRKYVKTLDTSSFSYRNERYKDWKEKFFSRIGHDDASLPLHLCIIGIFALKIYIYLIVIYIGMMQDGNFKNIAVSYDRLFDLSYFIYFEYLANKLMENRHEDIHIKNQSAKSNISLM